MSDDPVSEAVQLLQRRRTELLVRAATISTDINKIEKALDALGEPTQADLPPAVERSFRQRHGRRSLAGVVLEVLEEQDRDWSPVEIVEELRQRGDLEGRVGDPASGVRTALWQLRKDGKAVMRGDGHGARTIAAKWAPDEV
jgi:hypothetical protein